MKHTRIMGALALILCFCMVASTGVISSNDDDTLESDAPMLASSVSKTSMTFSGYGTATLSISSATVTVTLKGANVDESCDWTVEWGTSQGSSTASTSGIASKTVSHLYGTNGTWNISIYASAYYIDTDNFISSSQTQSTSVTIDSYSTTTSYTVRFNTNGGSAYSGTQTSMSVASGTRITLPSSGYYYSGHDLTGWRLNSTSGTLYSPGSTYVVTSAVTFYAVWTSNTITVTYNASGGVFANGLGTYSQVIYKNMTTSPPADPVKDMSIFSKWVTSSGTTFEFNTSLSSNITLYAQYAEHFTIAIENNIVTITIASGYTSASSHTVEWGDGKESSSELSTLTHVYTATGSYVIKVSSKTYSETASSSTAITVDNIPTYTITFNSNEGSSVTSQSVISGETASKPADPTKDGFTFAGWYTDADLKTAYDFSQPVTANLTLYARWIEGAASIFTVVFDSEGGTSVIHQSVISGETASKPADPTKDGYTFAGWYTDADLKTAYDFSQPVTANLTLYASWTALSSEDEPTTPGDDETDDAKDYSKVYMIIGLIVIIAIIAYAIRELIL